MDYEEIVTRLEEAIEETEWEHVVYPHDMIHELVDMVIPVYTGDILEIAQSKTSLATTEPEILGYGGKSTAVNAIVGNLYDDLDAKACEILNEEYDLDV